MTLSLYADDIRFITNVSPGKIISAVINDFEALADPGRLVAVIENMGCIGAKFEVTAHCNANILKQWSQEASVGPGQYVRLLPSCVLHFGGHAALLCRLNDLFGAQPHRPTKPGTRTIFMGDRVDSVCVVWWWCVCVGGATKTARRRVPATQTRHELKSLTFF